MAARPFVCLVLFLLSALVVQSQDTANEHQCPANTFTCGDASCIPKDWVGDGEPDCDDGSDEKPTAAGAAPTTTILFQTTGGTVRTSPSVNNDSASTVSLSGDVATQVTAAQGQPVETVAITASPNQQQSFNAGAFSENFEQSISTAAIVPSHTDQAFETQTSAVNFASEFTSNKSAEVTVPTLFRATPGVFDSTGNPDSVQNQTHTPDFSASDQSNFNGQSATTGVFQSDQNTTQPQRSGDETTADLGGSISSAAIGSESEPAGQSTVGLTVGFNEPIRNNGALQSELNGTVSSVSEAEALPFDPHPTFASDGVSTVGINQGTPTSAFNADAAAALFPDSVTHVNAQTPTAPVIVTTPGEISTSDFGGHVESSSSVRPSDTTSDSASPSESAVFSTNNTPGQIVDTISSQAPIALNGTSPPAGDYPEYEEDGPKVSTNVSAPTVPAAVGCSSDHRALVERCTTAISTWMIKLGQIDPNQPFFTEPTQHNWQLANEGCQLFPQFKQCLGPLFEKPGECIGADTIAYWESLEAYTCQFLLPSAQEHRPCFQKLDNHPCQLTHLRIDPTQRSLDGVCNLVFSVKLQLDCIDQVSAECEQASREIVGPLRNETNMFDNHYECSKNSPPTVVAGQLTTVATSASSSSDCASVEAMAQCQPLIAPILMNAEMNIFSLANESARLQKMCATFDQWKMCVAKVPNAECWLDKGPLKMSAIITDIFCTPQVSEQMAVHKKCLMNTSADERVVPCQAQLDAANEQQNLTACKALDLLNTYIDCALPAVNDQCTVEAQDFVISIQAKLSDKEINNQCYEQTAVEAPVSGFQLTPHNTRCTDEQENSALSCLVDLMALQGEFNKFGNNNLFLEISDQNSTLLNNVCGIYDKYEKCLEDMVFAKTGGSRCSFNAPLNTLARVGLSPVCDPEARMKLTANRACLEKLAPKPEFNQCARQLFGIGAIMAHMLKGGENGEAHLCQGYYMIRDMFGCLEPMVKSECGEAPLGELIVVKQKITTLGVEEGCPGDRPNDFDDILHATTPSTSSSVKPDVAANIEAPMAHAHAHAPVAEPLPKAQGGEEICQPEDQQKFADCVLPITKLQPHPLAVIKQPKQIQLACTEFKKFLQCREPINCRPLWAEGMVGMFTYACGDGNADYLQVRQCVRKVTTRQDVRGCVEEFSKGAPSQACITSNALLQCAMPSIADKCDQKAATFVHNYVTRFATAVDHSCVIADHGTGPARPVTSVNCTAEEANVLNTCGSQLDVVAKDLADLFKGGLQSFLGNMNKLGPIFARGCSLTESFKTCARPIIEGPSSCQASSCLLKAGDGVCNETDQAAAIDKHLNCVFALIADPDFGKCLRETLATLKDFSLKAIKVMLPKFVDCVEPKVVEKCGPTPINVLRAMGTTGLCVINFDGDTGGVPSAEPLPLPIVPVVPVCTPEIKTAHDQCVREHLQRHNFMPVALLSDPANVDHACSDVVNYKTCVAAGHTAICEEKNSAALVAMLDFVCREINLVEYKKHGACLSNVSVSEPGQKCLSLFLTALPDDSCRVLGESANCASHSVNENCGEMALHLSYEAMNYFAKKLNQSCSLEVPSVALNTGCSEEDLVTYLGCETNLDKFELRPISIIKNASHFDDFCKAFNEQYRPCVQAMACRFEPVSTANTNAFEFLCNTPLKQAEYRKNGQCLAEYIESDAGRKCADAYHAIDFLAADAAKKVCAAFDKTLACAAAEIDHQCGLESVMFAYDIHTTWAHGFDTTCNLIPPDLPSNTSATGLLLEPIGQPEPTGVPQPVQHTENEPSGVPEPVPTGTPSNISVSEHEQTSVPEPESTGGFEAAPTSHPEPIATGEPHQNVTEPDESGRISGSTELPLPEHDHQVEAEPTHEHSMTTEPGIEIATEMSSKEMGHNVTAEPEPAISVEPDHTASAEPEPAVSVEPEHSASAEPEPAVSTEPDHTASAEPEPAVSVEPEHTASAEPEPAVSAEPEHTVSAEPGQNATAEPEPTHPIVNAEPEPTASTTEIPKTEPDKKPEPESGASATENDSKSAQKARISAVATLLFPILVMALSRW